MTTRSFRIRQRGFTLLETMIAIVLLGFGVLSLAFIFIEGMQSRSLAQSDMIAKEKAAQAMESIFTARDAGALTWAQIHNTSSGGVFLTGPRPLLDPGPDGLVNTADDNAANPDAIVDPGPDGILGTADDIIIPLSNYTREVLITSQSPTLRRIQIIMRYTIGRVQRSYTLESAISQYN